MKCSVLLLAAVLCCVAFPGCKRPQTTGPAAVPATALAVTAGTNSAFQARLLAAKQIASLTDRDEAFSKLTEDAATAGSVPVVMQAVQGIASLEARDKAAAAAALTLGKAGNVAAAVQTAKLIASLNLRDDTLKRLAKNE